MSRRYQYLFRWQHFGNGSHSNTLTSQTKDFPDNLGSRAYGGEVSEAQKAAKKLAKDNISAEIIDLRSLYPLDTDTIFESIKKTHRVVIVQEAQKMAGVGAQVASAISEGAIMYLDAPVTRVAAPNSVYPFPQAENVWLPGARDIEDAVREVINY